MVNLKHLLLFAFLVAQPCIFSGCTAENQAGDATAQAIDKRMKQVEKDASNVSSKRDSGSK
jgi:outer membrane lipoprotein-sorting protein